VDVKHKLNRGYAEADAAQHDRQVFEQILSGNTSKDVWADSAYRSTDRLERLAKDGFREHIQRKEPSSQIDAKRIGRQQDKGGGTVRLNKSFFFFFKQCFLRIRPMNVQH